MRGSSTIRVMVVLGMSRSAKLSELFLAEHRPPRGVCAVFVDVVTVSLSTSATFLWCDFSINLVWIALVFRFPLWCLYQEYISVSHGKCSARGPCGLCLFRLPQRSVASWTCLVRRVPQPFRNICCTMNKSEDLQRRALGEVAECLNLQVSQRWP